MLDIKFIRENKDKVVEGARRKGIKVNVDELLQLDKEAQILKLAQQKLQEDRNKAAKEKDIETGKRVKREIDLLEEELNPLDQKLNRLLFLVPNLPKDDVKVGKNETENEVIRKNGEVPSFPFKPKDHLEIGESLDLIDVDRAAKVSGARFFYLKNEGALLEMALLHLAMDLLTEEGFIPVIPPALIKTTFMKKLGYMEGGGSEDMFHLEKDGLTLIGTAEHALVSMHADETLDSSELPKRYVGYSPSFRREAGSYGKDTRGIIRVHEFNKVEMVSFVKEGEDDKEQEYLLSLEEKLFQLLEIPYQVVKMVTGDLGFPAARKYDIEAWMPSQEKYREVTSVSTVTDFQSRRLNTKYKDDGQTKFVQILNGTAFSMARPIAVILENYQEEDGSVRVPSALQKYLKFEKISKK